MAQIFAFHSAFWYTKSLLPNHFLSIGFLPVARHLVFTFLLSELDPAGYVPISILWFLL